MLLMALVAQNYPLFSIKRMIRNIAVMVLRFLATQAFAVAKN